VSSTGKVSETRYTKSKSIRVVYGFLQITQPSRQDAHFSTFLPLLGLITGAIVL
jgi:hypothetical protein